jgi:hypothetical protein
VSARGPNDARPKPDVGYPALARSFHSFGEIGLFSPWTLVFGRGSYRSAFNAACAQRKL